jgi:transposase InsO family protein
MKYSAHPERRTAFQQAAQACRLIHATCRKAAPWQNGFIERSHRTDNEEVFRLFQFATPEERRYQHRLFEMFYNTQRPHQGLGGKTPVTVFREEYPLHAFIVC